MKRDFWLDQAQTEGLLDRGDGTSVRVAIIDSGIDFTHPALADTKRGVDVSIASEEGRLNVVPNLEGDCYGHGTAVAGIIHAIAPSAEIGSFRVLGVDNGAKSDAVRRGALAAIESGYQILNVSIGCGRMDHVLKYKDWVDRAYLAGVHVVAACNNHNYRRVEWPGHFSSVNTVNMTPDSYELLFQENSLVEFATGGVRVTVPWLGHSMRVQTGSSFSAPRLAGLLARVLSVYPDIGVLQAKSLLRWLASRSLVESTVSNA